MKKTRTRQRSHRTSTPSVICLPPPKPPVGAPRKEPEVDRAIHLPKSAEPLVTGAASSRQTRRKAQRAQAKSKGQAAVHEPAPQLDVAPLPRNRSLARQPTGLIARASAWFSSLLPRKAAARAPAVSPEAMAEQMVALRSELAMVQGRLDRMIAAVSRP